MKLWHILFIGYILFVGGNGILQLIQYCTSRTVRAESCPLSLLWIFVLSPCFSNLCCSFNLPAAPSTSYYLLYLSFSILFLFHCQITSHCFHYLFFMIIKTSKSHAASFTFFSVFFLTIFHILKLSNSLLKTSF